MNIFVLFLQSQQFNLPSFFQNTQVLAIESNVDNKRISLPQEKGPKFPLTRVIFGIYNYHNQNNQVTFDFNSECTLNLSFIQPEF